MEIKRIMNYYKPYKKELLLDLLHSVMQSGLVTLIPILIKYLTANSLSYEKEDTYKVCCLFGIIFIVTFFLISLCIKYREYHGNTVASKIEADIKINLFEHFQRQDFSFFDENKTGKLSSYITIDAHRLSKFVIKFPETVLDFIIRFSGASIFLFLSNYIFGFIVFSILLFILYFFIKFIFLIRQEIKKSKKIYSEIIAGLNEEISGIKTVKIFNNEDEEKSKFKRNMEFYLDIISEKNKLISKMKAFVQPFLEGIVPIVTVVSIFFILNEKITMNDLVIFMLYADILISPIFNIFEAISDYNENIVSLKRIFYALSVNPEITDSDSALSLEKSTGKITFKNVSFKYKSSDEIIINNINFEICSGEHIALVGKSGVGKSSICNLIPRFYDATKGEILLDNIPIKNIKLKDLRKNISFVQQDTFLFSDTIIENIRYGRLNASDEEVFEAANNAFADEFIFKFENGYQTQIGERGVKLSGGQKQRLSIARAFLKNAPILIFDEATSNLDSESEKFIQKSIQKLSKGRTTIIVAHRLSTIKNADRIFVLEDHAIQEEGTHQELLEKNDGLYKRLYDRQIFMNNGIQTDIF